MPEHVRLLLLMRRRACQTGVLLLLRAQVGLRVLLLQLRGCAVGHCGMVLLLRVLLRVWLSHGVRWASH